MYKAYLTIAIRNLRKQSLFSALNITGLSLGVAACLLIALYVSHELTYDRWNPQADRIVRPVADIVFGGNKFDMAVVSSMVGPDCGKEMPEVQSWCRFRENGSFLVRKEGEGQQNIREETVLRTDSTFFEVFPVRILEGDPVHTLSRPNTLAISRSRAEKYFTAPQLAVGQTLILDNRERWQISAVYEDLPVNTHFKADFLLSLSGDPEIKDAPVLWASNNNWQTYLLLHKGVDFAVFEKKFYQLTKEKLAVTIQTQMGISVAEFEKTGNYARFPLQRLTDIHLYSDLDVELRPNGSIQHVWIFSAIAAFILLIACINFMNLATARSSGRAKEVGVRKSLGSGRSALMHQFLTESVLIAGIAVALAVVMAAVAMPWFSNLADRDLSMPWQSVPFWAVLVAATVVVGLLAGSYPAFFLSAFNVVRVLKGGPASHAQGGRFRSALVVFQFAASVALIVSTLLVTRQLDFIQSSKLGFDKNRILILEDAPALGANEQAFKNAMLQEPAIKSATVSGFLPVTSYRSDRGISSNRSVDAAGTVSMQTWRVDPDYIPTMGMELVYGRNFDAARPADSSGIIINETAARLYGFTGDPTGQKLYDLLEAPNSETGPDDFAELTILGVVKDFHWASLRENIGALSLHLGPSSGSMSFRYEGDETAAVIAALEKNWKNLAPGQPFNYRFMDDAFAEMYKSEQRVRKIAGVFAILSILISCLGLFGLAAYTTERRTKEIGIRKVLGASVMGITGLLAQDFLKLVVVSIVVATPVAWYLMRQWLDHFAYRIPIQWWVFAAAGFAAIAIAFLTVSFQSIRAALMNPVRALRAE